MAHNFEKWTSFESILPFFSSLDLFKVISYSAPWYITITPSFGEICSIYLYLYIPYIYIYLCLFPSILSTSKAFCIPAVLHEGYQAYCSEESRLRSQQRLYVATRNWYGPVGPEVRLCWLRWLLVCLGGLSRSRKIWGSIYAENNLGWKTTIS